MGPRCIRHHVHKSVSTALYSLHLSPTFPVASLFSTFFRLGQTLETFRGNGIYQPSVDVAITKLNQGGWV